MEFGFPTLSPAQINCDLLLFVVFENEFAQSKLVAELNANLDGVVLNILQDQDFRGKSDQSVILNTYGRLPANWVGFVGAGKRTDVTPGFTRSVAARAAKFADKNRARHVVCVLPKLTSSESALRMAIEGTELGLYRFDKYRTDPQPTIVLSKVDFVLEDNNGVVGADSAPVEDIQQRAKLTVSAIRLARDMVNETPHVMVPTRLAAIAEQVAADQKLDCTVYGMDDIRRMNMQLLLAVNAGSDEEARFVHMVYKPDGDTTGLPQVALVGKGITFDSGGYNLKPTGAIDDMKVDMAGAAAVIGTMAAIRAISPRCVVHAIVPTTENLVNGRAYKLGDVYYGMNGKTVEIRNTDAEGRLILADGLCYAVNQGVQHIISMATLTGACVIALGPYCAGALSNNDTMVREIINCADSAGEDMWQLPLSRKLKKMLKSDVADMKNVGERWGGTITAALFLEEFVDETPWVHIDLAGPSYIEQAVDDHIPKGGSGYGILTMLEYLSRFPG